MSKDYTIYEVAEKLIGHIGFDGETNHDNDSRKNIEQLNELLMPFIEKLAENTRLADRVEFSAKEIASASEGILKNIIETIYHDNNNSEQIITDLFKTNKEIDRQMEELN